MAYMEEEGGVDRMVLLEVLAIKEAWGHLPRQVVAGDGLRED